LILLGFSSDPARCAVRRFAFEVGDLVGLDGYLGIDRGGTTGDRKIAG